MEKIMKLLIASDIHGAAQWCARLMDAIDAEQPDRVVLLGDLLYHGPRNDLPADYAPKEVVAMLNGIADRVICVRGNCEAEVDQMVLDFPCMADYDVLWDPQAPNPHAAGAGRELFLTHGHVWGPGIHNSVDHMLCFVNLSFHKTASVRFTRQREDSSRTSVALAPILSSPTTPRA